MPVFTDQLGRTLSLTHTPQRIISLVPSQTELLYHLGLAEEVIGITKFCIHPAKWFKTKTRVGGTKQLHHDKIKALQPHLIIANKEENVKEQVEELAKDFPVWVSDVADLESALQMIGSIGILVDKEKNAEALITGIKTNFLKYTQQITNSKLKTAYLIWRNPYMTVGGDTFINAMLHYAGFENVFAHKTRYPETTIEELKKHNVQLLLLSSEPYPFKQKHIEELQQHLPATTIVLADGEAFSWHGSHLLKAPEYFQQLAQQIAT